VTDSQPGGRAPAPAPLDLLQDFVNTEIPEWARDDISSPSELAAWFAGRRLLEADAPVTADAFLRARALRSCLRALALANTTGAPPAPADRAAMVAALGDLRFAFAVGADGEPRMAPAGDGVDRALATLVSIALDSTRDATWSRLKACRKTSCGWIFYDHSRNRSSNWCSMAICGNRTKTAGYRLRRAAS
jgi:predicted RNA-binding Zn ribbon-like protein